METTRTAQDLAKHLDRMDEHDRLMRKARRLYAASKRTTPKEAHRLFLQAEAIEEEAENLFR
jgi:hypothetical protein